VVLASSLKTLVRSAALERDDFKWVEAQRRRGTDTTYMATTGAPRTDLGFFGLRPRSLSSASRLVGLAQAARPLAGGSPKFVRDQAAQAGCSVAALTNYGRVWYKMNTGSALVHHLVQPSVNPSLNSKCGLTLRSSRPAPAWHLAREALWFIIRLAGQAPRLRGRLNSNVRPHMAALR
jgi:hypothetical protein